MQFCPSFHIVQLIKEGHTPQESCDMVVRKMRRECAEGFEVGVIALDVKVRVQTGLCGVWQYSWEGPLSASFCKRSHDVEGVAIFTY